MIPWAVAFPPYARNCASEMFTFWGGGFFQRSTAKAPEPIFTRNTSNNPVPRKYVPFRDLKKHLYPVIEKPSFGPAFDGT